MHQKLLTKMVTRERKYPFIQKHAFFFSPLRRPQDRNLSKYVRNHLDNRIAGTDQGYF